jgi:hypothetical protein
MKEMELIILERSVTLHIQLGTKIKDPRQLHPAHLFEDPRYDRNVQRGIHDIHHEVPVKMSGS